MWYISPTHSENELVGSTRFASQRTSVRRTLGRSPGATLVGVATSLTEAERSAATNPLCFRCRRSRNPQISSATNPNIFCSEYCEQEFVRTALADITVEDCIRIHRRLERLLQGNPEAVV